MLCLVNPLIWKSLAPKKCKIFLWLAVRDKVYTKQRMARKSLSDSPLCPHGCQEEETIIHLLFSCTHVNRVWLKMGLPNICSCSDIIQALLEPPSNVLQVKDTDWTSIFTAVCWSIWLARNRKSFDNKNTTQEWVASNACDLLRLWMNRTTNSKRREAIHEWLIRNVNLAAS